MLQRVWRKRNPPLLFGRQTGAATVEKQVGGFPKHQKTELPYNPEVTFQAIYLKKTLKDTCTSMFTAAHTHIHTNGILLSHKKNEVKWLSCVWAFVIPWTVAYQAPPSMGFSRQEHWSGLPFPSPGDLPNPGIEPVSPALQADALPSELPGKPGNEWTNAICRNMDGPRDYHTKWSKSYGERQISWYHLSAESKKNDTDELIYETD